MMPPPLSLSLSLVTDTALPLLARFAAASAGCALLGLILASVLRRAVRRWPALAAHRTVWLACQGALLLAFLMALAPLPRAGLAPDVTLPTGPMHDMLAAHPFAADAAPAHRPAANLAAPAATVLSGRRSDATDGEATARRPRAAFMTMAASALPWLMAAWPAVYISGLCAVLLRRFDAARRWRATLRRHVRPLAPHGLGAWPGAAPDQVRRIVDGRLAVSTTDLPLSPMLLGVLRPCLLLPVQLDGFEAAQRTLIVEHELTHWRRRDPLWLAISSVITSLLWFNPFCRRLDAGLREAVELGCDDAVLAGRPAAERRGYAAALVAQLRGQHTGCAAPAFGQLGVAARVARMRDARPARLSGRARWGLTASALTLAIATAGLQPTLSTAALPAVAASVAETGAAAPAPHTAPPAAWRYPVEAPRVTALYGVRSIHTQAGHHGVDFGARRGAPVLAVAAGSVLETGADPAWGNYVRIDHGAGRQSLVMHLDRIDVEGGQQVAAGQAIGRAGATGRATGPHVHLEYWQDGHRHDPATVLAGLDSFATPRALARRAAQGHPHPTDE